MANIVYTYKCLANLISEKSNQSYSTVLYWLRCRLSFSLLRSAITCLRGPRFSYHHFKFSDTSIDLACAEGHLELGDNQYYRAANLKAKKTLRLVASLYWEPLHIANTKSLPIW